MNHNKHKRFDRTVWAFKCDFTGALAKWLVRQSPYTVPDNLARCIEDFHEKLDQIAVFDTAGMAEINLMTLTEKVDSILHSIPYIMHLNECRDGHGFMNLYGTDPNPDEDFIDITAVAQNITCDFADTADAQLWLDKDIPVCGIKS